MIRHFVPVFLLCISCYSQTVRIPKIEFSPEEYVCYKSDGPIIIDGKLDDLQWKKAKWTNNFVDIRGTKNIPRFCTKAKMLWDENYFYIATELEETDIWATLTAKDDTIFNDNCFEVFIDPDGDTQNYCELEINALNTIWDLLLIKTYRDYKKPAVSGWEIKGLKTNISIDGSLNKTGDKDSLWTIEIAFPWKVFKELTNLPVPPRHNDQWRVNFLRVEWMNESLNGNYRKKSDPLTRKPSVDFWSWCPQGIVNIHYPEMWGYVQFSDQTIGNGESEFIKNSDEQVKWYLRRLYYAERIYFDRTGKFTSDVTFLDLANQLIPGYSISTVIECTSSMFEAFIQSDDKTKIISINHEGFIKVKQLNQ